MRVCPVCGGENFSREIEVTREDPYVTCLPVQERQNARYRECSHCQSFYLSVKNIDPKSYTDGSYYDVDAKSEVFFMERFTKVIGLPKGRSDNLERVDRIHGYLRNISAGVKSQSVLDVGAGLGIFLKAFIGEGWKGYAVEPDPRLKCHLERVLPDVEIFSGKLEKYSFDVQHDLICLNRVVEHVEKAHDFLELCRKHLKVGGILYLELPDTASFYQDCANNEAFGYGHYVVYSPKGFEILAQKSGFQVDGLKRVQEPSGKFTIYGFLRPA